MMKTAGLLFALLLSNSVLAGDVKLAAAAFDRGEFKLALKEFAEAAHAGDPRAMAAVALMFEQGHGVGKDTKKAIEWYEKAALSGQPNAQHILGTLLVEGRADEGLEARPEEGFYWIKRAAENGRPSSMVVLADLYRNGLGTSKNPRRALSWLRVASDQGHAPAMLALADALSKGLGTSTDTAQAYFWALIAARSDPAAKQRLPVFASPLSEDEKAKVVSDVAQWSPSEITKVTLD